MQIIAVSVDPRGDTPKAVAAFLARHEMTGRMQYLIGSRQGTRRACGRRGGWAPNATPSSRSSSTTRGLVYGITGSGKRLTLYASSFQPSEIAHDVPLLAAR